MGTHALTYIYASRVAHHTEISRTMAWINACSFSRVPGPAVPSASPLSRHISFVSARFIHERGGVTIGPRPARCPSQPPPPLVSYGCMPPMYKDDTLDDLCVNVQAVTTPRGWAGVRRPRLRPHLPSRPRSAAHTVSRASCIPSCPLRCVRSGGWPPRGSSEWPAPARGRL